MKHKTIVFFDDTLIRYYIFEEENLSFSNTVVIPRGIINHGEIIDEAQISYLMKKHLESYSEGDFIYIINSPEIITRSMETPEISNEEIHSLVKNEMDQIFTQNINNYHPFYIAVDEEEDAKEVVISIVPKTMIDVYQKVGNDCKIEPLAIIPISLLWVGKINELRGVEVLEIGENLQGFHHFDKQKVYSRTFVGEGMGRLFEKNHLTYEKINNLLSDGFDERIAPLSKEDIEQEYYQALAADSSHLMNLSRNLSVDSRGYLGGILPETLGLSHFESFFQDYTILGVITYFDLAKMLIEREDLYGPLYSRYKKKHNSNQILYILGALAIAILLGSYIYGNVLDNENTDLRSEIESEQDYSFLDPEESDSEPSFSDEENQDVATTLNTVFANKPEEIDISSINYENGYIEINGETPTEELFNQWTSELESSFNQSLQVDPITNLDDTLYFRFQVGE